MGPVVRAPAAPHIVALVSPRNVALERTVTPLAILASVPFEVCRELAVLSRASAEVASAVEAISAADRSFSQVIQFLDRG